ncbi:MAG TPA: DNA-processing protein DprA [Thermodesulfobacteriota bacterium]
METRTIERGAPDYPPGLERLHDPPARLYVAGTWPWPPGVAIVGARAATPAGRRLAADLGAALAAVGVPVVSGLARGIDAAAHVGALEAGGPTLAVLGSGLDRIYPPEHAALADRVRRAGALVTEYPPGTPPSGWHFPRRNRLLAALSTAVVVVEAGERSGALGTARAALDLGLDVLAVPGPPGAPLARGTNGLIKAGAGLVEGPEDVLAAIGRTPRPPEREPERLLPSDDARRVLDVLAGRRLALDEIAIETGLSAGRVAAALLVLEMAGLVDPPTGQVYSARPGRLVPHTRRAS